MPRDSYEFGLLREGEAPAEPQERKTLSKKAQQELRPPEGLATKQFFCNARVEPARVFRIWIQNDADGNLQLSRLAKTLATLRFGLIQEIAAVADWMLNATLRTCPKRHSGLFVDGKVKTRHPQPQLASANCVAGSRASLNSPRSPECRSANPRKVGLAACERPTIGAAGNL